MTRTPIWTSIYTVILLCVSTSTVNAQTRFARPDTAVDLSRYRWVDECIVAGMRVARKEVNKNAIWIDTAARSYNPVFDSTPARAIEISRRCSEKFNPDTVPMEDLRPWLELFLTGGQTKHADILIARLRKAAKDSSGSDSLAEYTALTTIMNLYAGLQPIPWNKVVEIGARIDTSGVIKNNRAYLSLYGFLFRLATSVSDTVTQHKMATKLIDRSNRLSANEKETDWYRYISQSMVASAFDYMSDRALQDSLRISGSAYVALRRANWARARGNNADPLPGLVGEMVPPLVADYWFAPQGSGTSTSAGPNNTTAQMPLARPTKGKVSLVVFLRGGCRDEDAIGGPFIRPTLGMDCWGTYATMRRLATRFPKLELTIVSQTTGYVGGTPPMEPDAEAKTLQSWWLGFHRIPATLAVVNTPFFRLQAPDSRRIDRSVENAVGYHTGGNRAAYLIDSNGMVLLFADELGRNSEKNFTDLLDVMMTRATKP